MRNIDPIIRQLTNGSSDDPDAEWKAAIALGSVKTLKQKTQAAGALMSALTSDRAHALIRAHAAESLGRIGDRRAVPTLVSALLKDSYRLVRAYGATALAALDDTEAIDPLLRALEKDEFFGVRAEAAKALGRLGQHQNSRDRVIKALVKARRAELSRSVAESERVLGEIDHALARIKDP